MSLKIRKSNQVNLEKKRPLFLLIGMFLSLGSAYLALEWSFAVKPLFNVDDSRHAYSDEIDWVVPSVPRTMPAKPIAAKQTKKVNPNIINVVSNQTQLPALDPSLFSGVIDEGSEVMVDPVPVDQNVYTFVAVESRPIFKGCESYALDEERFACFQSALMRYVAKNFKVSEEMKMFSSGEKIYVEFIIEKDGEVRHAEVVRGEDELIKQESLRLVKSLPKFTPAKINGKAVRMSYVLPVNVKLQ